MSCVEFFSYALILKGAERADSIIALLDEAKQQEIRGAVEQLKDVPVDTLRQLWAEQRRANELSSKRAGK
jgi:hypothetical protein